MVTTERMRKRFKGQLLIAGLMTFTGGIWFIASNAAGSLSPWSILLFCVGLLWWIMTRASIWWHHE